MEVKGETDSSDDRYVVYIHGDVGNYNAWYRIELPTTKDEHTLFGNYLPPKRISPVATFPRYLYGFCGSWDVIGNYIYWIGGSMKKEGYLSTSHDLIRHKVDDDVDVTSWEIVSSSIKIPSMSRFLAAVGTNKLCVLSGKNYCRYSSEDDGSGGGRSCGEIYDLDNKTWEYLKPDYQLFSDYDRVTLVQKYGPEEEEPTRFVVFSLEAGSMLFLDVPGTVGSPVTLANFNLFRRTSQDRFPRLQGVTGKVNPVFANDTFYWLTFEPCLYGYNTKYQRWLQSPSLAGQLPYIVDPDGPVPILVGLPQEGKLLAVIPSGCIQLIVASLTVAITGDSLSVSIDLIQRLSLDNDAFWLCDGKAFHGAYHLSRPDNGPDSAKSNARSGKQPVMDGNVASDRFTIPSSELPTGKVSQGRVSVGHGNILSNHGQRRAPVPSSNGLSNLGSVAHKREYNRDDFPLDLVNAKFFVIKPYSEDDIVKSIKYNVWSSTANGNKKLNSAYEDAQTIAAGNPRGCPVFLFFSVSDYYSQVNASGQFSGVAEMIGPVNFYKHMDFWKQDNWIGSFPVKWHIIKNVPNPNFGDIILENKPVANSSDTQELHYKKGMEMLKVFKNYRTSILDPFTYYETREMLLEEKPKLQSRIYETPFPVPVLDPRLKLNSIFDSPSSGAETISKHNDSRETENCPLVPAELDNPNNDTALKLASLTINPNDMKSQPMVAECSAATTTPAPAGSESVDAVTVGSTPVKANGFAESSDFILIGRIPLDPSAWFSMNPKLYYP